MLSAVEHCHLAGIVHRDLKLEYVLLSDHLDIKISDFGLGRLVRPDTGLLDTFCGTPMYASPELVKGIRYEGPPADIWALGVILYSMVAGKPPYVAGKDGFNSLYDKICAARYKCPPYFSPGKLIFDTESQRR